MSGASVPLRKTARVALIGLDEPTVTVLTGCFRNFGIDTAAFRIEDAERMFTEKFDATALYLDDGAQRILEIIRSAPANFRVVVYGLAKTTAQAVNLARYGINAIIYNPVEVEDAMRAIRATQLLVVREFRRYVRIPLITPVELHFEGGKFTGVGNELSTGGMSLAFDRKFPLGASAVLAFTLPGLAPLQISASVRWSKAGQLGVRFKEDDPGRRRVAQWIDDYLGIA